jgi:hypothetical protein
MQEARGSSPLELHSRCFPSSKYMLILKIQARTGCAVCILLVLSPATLAVSLVRGPSGLEARLLRRRQARGLAPAGAGVAQATPYARRPGPGWLPSAARGWPSPGLSRKILRHFPDQMSDRSAHIFELSGIWLVYAGQRMRRERVPGSRQLGGSPEPAAWRRGRWPGRGGAEGGPAWPGAAGTGTSTAPVPDTCRATPTGGLCGCQRQLGRPGCGWAAFRQVVSAVDGESRHLFR